MKKKIAIAAVAATALALLTPMSAMADANTAPTVGSATGQTSEAFWILNAETTEPLPVGGSVPMSLDVSGSNAAGVSPITAPTGAASFSFISPRGQERNQNAWNAYLTLGSAAVLALPPITPSGLTSAGFGSPAGIGAVSLAGGDYSLGLAFVEAGEVTKVEFTYITIVPGNIATTTYTYAQPAVVIPVAPSVTTDPTSQSAVAGDDVTFTAAATGTPTPSVQWESAPSASSTFTPISGATSDTLTVNDVQLANTGTQYRAVYTNSAGTDTSAVAVLTVTPEPVVKPVDGDANELASVTLGEGETSLVLEGTGIPAGTYGVWAWSVPTQLANATVNADGDVTPIELSGLDNPVGEHTVALVDIATNEVVAWLLVTLSSSTSSVTDLSVDVLTSNKFALEGVAASVDLGDAARGASTSNVLPAFTVTDDRALLPGWDLTSAVDDFVNAAAGNDTIDKSALSIEARKVGAAVDGITAKGLFVAGTSNLFAEGLANSSTPSTGTQFDANLTFLVPADAKAGTYTSKLTLTLTSK
ncbi:immunoglobulin domain-containing protein [Protaetiibacter larvae]|nr:immunoglobulin domain-containing protein [Protaetiibacter larvae]